MHSYNSTTEEADVAVPLSEVSLGHGLAQVAEHLLVSKVKPNTTKKEKKEERKGEERGGEKITH